MASVFSLIARDRTRLRWLPLGAFIVLLAALVFSGRAPTGQQAIFAWILIGLLCASVGNLRGWARGVLVDWLPFYCILSIYGWLRGRADGVVSGAHYHPQIAFDNWLGHGTALTVRLQHWLYTPGTIHWYDYAAWSVYMTHFFLSFLVLAVLWRVNISTFRRFMGSYLVLTLVGYLTYLLYPAKPPWLSSVDGALPATTRVVHQVWQHVGANAVAAMFASRPGHDANVVAAVPSLHAAYPVLMLLLFWGAGWKWRTLLGAYSVAMATSLVYGAEHFVFDVLLGWGYAVGSFFAYRAMAPRVAMRLYAVSARWHGRAAQLPVAIPREPEAPSVNSEPEVALAPTGGGA